MGMGGGPGGPPPGMGGPPRGGMMGGPPPGMMRGGGGAPPVGGPPPSRGMGGPPTGGGGGPPPMAGRGGAGGPMGGGPPGMMGNPGGPGGARGGSLSGGRGPAFPQSPNDPRQNLEKDPSAPPLLSSMQHKPGRVVEIQRTKESGRITADHASAYLSAINYAANVSAPPFYGMGGTASDVREFTAAKAISRAAYNLSQYEKDKLEQAPQRTKGVKFLGEKARYVSKEEQDAKSELPQLPYLFISSKSEHDRLLDDGNAIAWQIIPILAAKPKLPRSVREISTELRVVTRHVLSAKYGGLLKYAGQRRHLFNVLRDKNGVPHLILTPAARMELYKRWNQRAGIKDALGVTGHSGVTPYFSKAEPARTVVRDKKGMAVLDHAVASEEEANVTDLV